MLAAILLFSQYTVQERVVYWKMSLTEVFLGMLAVVLILACSLRQQTEFLAVLLLLLSFDTPVDWY